jgi:hypothetical protein
MEEMDRLRQDYVQIGADRRGLLRALQHARWTMCRRENADVLQAGNRRQQDRANEDDSRCIWMSLICTCGERRRLTGTNETEAPQPGQIKPESSSAQKAATAGKPEDVRVMTLVCGRSRPADQDRQASVNRVRYRRLIMMFVTLSTISVDLTEIVGYARIAVKWYAPRCVPWMADNRSMICVSNAMSIIANRQFRMTTTSR